MKFVYGKRDFATRERGEENCYLLTNGLGGFSSATMIGSATRSDHAFLMACTRAPNHRFHLIHRLEEEVVIQGDSVHISSQKFADRGREPVNRSQELADCDRDEDGFLYLNCFTFEDYPRWTFQVGGVEIIKETAMKQLSNTVAVRYRIDNRTAGEVDFVVTPYLQFVPKGGEVLEGQAVFARDNKIWSDQLQLSFHTDGETEYFPPRFVRGLFYAYDACDGRRSQGNAWVNHRVKKTVSPHSRGSLEIVYRGEEAGTEEVWESAGELIAAARSNRKKLEQACGLASEAGRMLAKSAGQFISLRESTGGKTILAGYPFFGDWGRDTMIALPGCCITTGQTETAKSILLTFAGYCRKGLLPNLFPEGKDEPLYNTADASLLFVNAVYLYYEKTKDISFVKKVWPVMKEMAEWYQKGTDYCIGMDEDGLLRAGDGLDQVTWMDVRVGTFLPTPRHGKPVEINAYWYNALCIMAYFYDVLENTEKKNPFRDLSRKVKKSFCEKFWDEEMGCLKDLVSGTDADRQVRCNQIWAVSMAFGPLDKEKERKVVDAVYEKLYTPLGLRTLEMGDSQFHGRYGGTQMERDAAYHQGTVWIFPLGAYYLAYLKTRNYSKEALDVVKRQLEALESALGEGCIGQLPEIYDGENPDFSRGCFAQAWSVGEILRVYEACEIHAKRQ